jgi:hypothetical protein
MVKHGTFDQMACMCRNEFGSIPYSEALAGTKIVDMQLYEMAMLFY